MDLKDIFPELITSDNINLEELEEQEINYLANRQLINLVKSLNALISELDKTTKKIEKTEKKLKELEEYMDENMMNIEKLELYDTLNSLLIDYNFKKEIKDLLFKKISNRISILKEYLNRK